MAKTTVVSSSNNRRQLIISIKSSWSYCSFLLPTGANASLTSTTNSTLSVPTLFKNHSLLPLEILLKEQSIHSPTIHSFFIHPSKFRCRRRHFQHQDQYFQQQPHNIINQKHQIIKQ